jgi:tetratricopeptide (TPR) repeat protein
MCGGKGDVNMDKSKERKSEIRVWLERSRDFISWIVGLLTLLVVCGTFVCVLSSLTKHHISPSPVKSAISDVKEGKDNKAQDPEDTGEMAKPSEPIEDKPTPDVKDGKDDKTPPPPYIQKLVQGIVHAENKKYKENIENILLIFGVLLTMIAVAVPLSQSFVHKDRIDKMEGMIREGKQFEGMVSELYKNLRRFKKSVKIQNPMKSLKDKKSDDPIVKEGDEAFGRGRYGEALDHYKKAREKYEEKGGELDNKFISEDDYYEALDRYEEALEGYEAGREQDYHVVRLSYEKALSKYEKRKKYQADIYGRLSRAYRWNNELDDSLMCAETAIRLYPEKPIYYFLRGVAFRELKLWDESLRDITGAIVRTEKNLLRRSIKEKDVKSRLADYYFGRAVTLFEMERDDLADKDVNKVLELTSGQHKEEFLRDFAAIYGELAKQIEEPAKENEVLAAKKNKYERLARMYEAERSEAEAKNRKKTYLRDKIYEIDGKESKNARDHEKLAENYRELAKYTKDSEKKKEYEFLASEHAEIAKKLRKESDEAG